MAMGSYQMALQEAQSSGQAGRIIPSGGAGGIRYRFVPSGPTPQKATTAMPSATTSGSSLTPEALKSFTEAKSYYAPGGGFGKGVEAGLERGRVRSTASGLQSLISSGLAGTTMAAGLGKKYEEEVAAPTRAGVESERAQRLSSLSMALGGAEQGAFESGAGRSLSERLANLQAGTSIQLAGMRRPTGGGASGFGRTQPTTRFGVSRPAPTSGGYFTGRSKIPTAAPSLFAPTAPIPTAEAGKTWSEEELQELIQRTGSRLRA